MTSLPSTLMPRQCAKLSCSSPLGPLTVTKLPSPTVTVTPAGITTGILPILDISVSLLDYHTKASTSPPTFSLRACLSVMMPLEVETIAIPRPFMTFGISSQFE